MAERTSAGILLYRRPSDGRLEVLLAHPGGPYFAKRDLGDWTIPKGEPDDAHEPLDAVARREFAEETGIEIDRRRRPSSSARSSRRAARSSMGGRF